MIQIETASFFSVRAPRYSFDGGERLYALKPFPPFIKSDLYALISEDGASKKLADTFNRFVIITFTAMLFAGFGAIMSASTYFGFRGRIFFTSTLLLLAMSLISNFMAWYKFRRMSEAYMAFVRNKRETGINFEHFEINDNGIFRREIGTKKTDLI